MTYREFLLTLAPDFAYLSTNDFFSMYESTGRYRCNKDSFRAKLSNLVTDGYFEVKRGPVRLYRRVYFEKA